MTPAAYLRQWLFSVFLLTAISASGQSSKPIFIAINEDLRYFVETTERFHAPPMAKFEINETILKAAILFDALGAYGIRHEPEWDQSTLFSKSAKDSPDSIYANPPSKVFTSRKGSSEELAVLYSGILEAAGIVTAIQANHDRVLVLLNTGVHKKYAGAISRDITAYFIKHHRVWLPVDVTWVGLPFYEAWTRAAGHARGKIYDVIPVRVMIKSKEIGTARVFGSNLSKMKLEQLFEKDQAFFEKFDTREKWTRVEALRSEDHNRAMIHFKRGVQHLEAHEADAAIVEFRNAADLGADLSQTLFFIGKAYGEKRDYENMKRIGLQLVEVQKRDPRGYQLLGLAYHLSGNDDAGKQLLARAKFLETNTLAAAK